MDSDRQPMIPADARSSPRAPRHDRQLLREASLGNVQAWDALVDAHAQWVWGLARRFTERADEAASVSELVWRRLAQSIPLASTEPLSHWLHAAVLAESVNAGARAGRSSVTASEERRRHRRHR